MQLLKLERCRVVPDHFAVDCIRLFQKPLRFRVFSRLPRVQPDCGNACGKAFDLKVLLVRARRLEADDGSETLRFLDEFCSAAFCVPDVFLGSVRVADVETVLSDIHPNVCSGLIHGILTLSYELKRLLGLAGSGSLCNHSVH